jgi:hypothetical protein
MVAQHALLTNLFKLALNDSASPQARAVASLKIDQLKSMLTERVKGVISEIWLAHYTYQIKLINSFTDDPKEFKSENLISPPPGQPIGQDEDFCSGIQNH